MAALLGSNFPEADAVQVHALMYAALVLLLVAAVVSVAGLSIQWLAMGAFERKKS